MTVENIMKLADDYASDRVIDYANQGATSIREKSRAALLAAVEELAKDAELWVAVDGYEGFYEVSSIGRVRSVKRVDSDGNQRNQKYLHPSAIVRKGYLKVTLWKNNISKEVYVHRLVAHAFINPVDGCQQVNHKDGDPANNEVSNLEWVNNQQNAIHSARELLRNSNKPIVGVPVSGGDAITFASFALAKEAGFVRANILKCIKGERTHHGGYVWSYMSDAAMKGQS